MRYEITLLGRERQREGEERFGELDRDISPANLLDIVRLTIEILYRYIGEIDR